MRAGCGMKRRKTTTRGLPMIDHSKPPCSECGSYDSDRHHPRCSLQTVEQRAAQLETYYAAWLRDQNKEAETRKRMLEAHAKLRDQVAFWQGKYRIVVAENNALRRKL